MCLFFLDVKRQADRVLATMCAQAFLHPSSKHRRPEPLADVRHGETLRGLAVDVRMAIYDSRVATKNQVRHERETMTSTIQIYSSFNRISIYKII